VYTRALGTACYETTSQRVLIRGAYCTYLQIHKERVSSTQTIMFSDGKWFTDFGRNRKQICHHNHHKKYALRFKKVSCAKNLACNANRFHSNHVSMEMKALYNNYKAYGAHICTVCVEDNAVCNMLSTYVSCTCVTC
jgi:hypothetical protein